MVYIFEGVHRYNKTYPPTPNPSSYEQSRQNQPRTRTKRIASIFIVMVSLKEHKTYLRISGITYVLSYRRVLSYTISSF